MIIVKPAELDGIVQRMLELTSRSTPWHRRNWRPSTLEMIEETISEASIPGTAENALKDLIKQLSHALENDPAITNDQRRILDFIKDIKSLRSPHSYNSRLVHRYAQDIETSYLHNWAEAFKNSSANKQLDIEGTAKRIISHVLYRGVPPASVFLIIKDRLDSPHKYCLGDILRILDERINFKKSTFHFAVPVNRKPTLLYATPKPDGWMFPEELKQWKREYAPNAKSIRHHGGFILKVDARDINEAANYAQNILSQLSFKFEFGSSNHFSISTTMWSQEKGTAFPTRPEVHSGSLKAFQLTNSLHELAIDKNIRNILSLLSLS